MGLTVDIRHCIMHKTLYMHKNFDNSLLFNFQLILRITQLYLVTEDLLKLFSLGTEGS